MESINTKNAKYKANARYEEGRRWAGILAPKTEILPNGSIMLAKYNRLIKRGHR